METIQQTRDNEINQVISLLKNTKIEGKKLFSKNPEYPHQDIKIQIVNNTIWIIPEIGNIETILIAKIGNIGKSGVFNVRFFDKNLRLKSKQNNLDNDELVKIILSRAFNFGICKYCQKLTLGSKICPVIFAGTKKEGPVSCHNIEV